MTNEPHIDHAERLIEAARTKTHNTLASWTRELATLLEVLADTPIVGADLPPQPYRVAAANLLDHAAIVAAFAKPYPQALRAEAFAIVAAVQAVAEPIRDGQSDTLLDTLGRDAARHNLQTFARLGGRYSQRLADLADRAAGHDIEHGQPNPPTPTGKYSPSELAKAVENTPNTPQPSRRAAPVEKLSQKELAEHVGISREIIRQAAIAAGLAPNKQGGNAIYTRRDWLAMANAHADKLKARPATIRKWNEFLARHDAGQIGIKPKASKR